LGYVFGDPDFCEGEFRHGEWNFRWEDFIVYRESGRILACALPWAPDSHAKKMSFTEAPRFLEGGLKLLSRLGLKVPERHEPIKTLYMTHLNISALANADTVISKFLDFTYRLKLNRAYEMISFPDWWNLGPRSRSLQFAVHQTVDVGIYSIAVAGHELVAPVTNQTFNFEMAVI
jgi:hypothetical protein